MKVLHVIPTLELGGAERLLTALVTAQSKDDQSSVQVFTLLNGGRQMAAVRAAGVPVREFNMVGTLGNKVRALVSLRRAIATSDADVIHAWMYHSALLACLFARNRRRVLIAIHHTNPRDAGLPRATRLIALGCSLGSRLSGAVVYVADAAKVKHEQAGFSSRRSCVVHVGVDEKTMMPALDSARTQSRQRFGIPQDAIVVAHIARYHRDKDQPTLLGAFAQSLSTVARMHLLLVGRHLDESNIELRKLIEAYGIQDNVSLVGELDSTLEAFHAADIFCLSSLTEAFPVSLVEALQCGLLPVVTDVGECRAIAQGVGLVVPPNSVQDLADALLEAAAAADSRVPMSIRARGLEFSLSQMHDDYQAVYARIVALGAGSDLRVKSE